ncbi:hypothetical protein J6590_070676 [Homalodisca vitripennis]|nr:hypothetical protein J6590_070676 [Homalodisca vitripennis]
MDRARLSALLIHFGRTRPANLPIGLHGKLSNCTVRVPYSKQLCDGKHLKKHFRVEFPTTPGIKNLQEDDVFSAGGLRFMRVPISR